MKPWLLILLLLSVCSSYGQLKMNEARFRTGDNPEWSKPGFDDNSWQKLLLTDNWDVQGFKDYNGYAWYRIHITIPLSLKDQSFWPDSIRIGLAKIDDADEVYLNGSLIGKTGSFPGQPKGYVTAWDHEREYRVGTNNPVIRWDQDNVIAIKVYDGGGPGGIFGGEPSIIMLDLIDGIKLDIRTPQVNAGNKLSYPIVVTNIFNRPIAGTLKIQVTESETGKTIYSQNKTATIARDKNLVADIGLPLNKRLEVIADFEEKKSGKIVSLKKITPYILTPGAASIPRINGAKTFGVRPGSPFLFKIPATGNRPMQFSVENLPAGLKLNTVNGLITGTLTKPGEYKMIVAVKNDVGEAKREFTVVCGNLLALTPPMGWNSWNCWGLTVSDEKVRSSAQALIDKGLADHGWTYINIDDGWEAAKRNPKGEILANEKFPNMKSLGQWLHDNGLKFGIYSSPGPTTCGGYLGSYKYEKLDAATYASWGIDYLKYDWCSYGDLKEGKDTSLAAFQRPYKTMQNFIRAQKQDIVYSLCQYGMKNVWQWGSLVDGNCWRTTGDITDTWKSLRDIGFSQTKQHPFAKPGRWNDPDMLIVGELGWGEKLHPTRLTPDEQYTHISLWCLLSSPLLIGCDISKMDDFTLNLLTNDEVIELDQDPLGKQALQLLKEVNYEVWVKELEDGSKAVGIFNLGDSYKTISFKWSDIGLRGNTMIRDLWRQKDLGFTYDECISKVPPHGVTLLKVKETK
jgi:alpha-galactosidase